MVSNQDDRAWVFHFSDFLSEDNQGIMGNLYPLAWGVESKFLYFSAALGWSGGGNQCFPGIGWYGLYRLDLGTGTMATLIDGKNKNFAGDEIRFSPNGNYYAVDLNGVTITDLMNGDVETIDVSGVMEMVWSLDSRYLVFFVADCGDEFVETSSIHIWDSVINETRVLFSTNNMLLLPRTWIDSSLIEFIGEEWVGGDTHYLYTIFRYDLGNDEMIFSATATLRP